MAKHIALSFDDGPTSWTEVIVGALAKHNATATFFVNGDCLSRLPMITKAAVDCGCEIGNHGYSHVDMTHLDYEEIIAEITMTTALIEKLTSKPVLLRPPFGEYNDLVMKAGKQCGLALVNWSVDPGDWQSDDGLITRKRILAEITDGSIVLCHDRLASTAVLMASFIGELLEQGYRLVSVSQLFSLKRVKLQAGVLYNDPFSVPIE